MDTTSIVILAFALSMDALAVSICNGLLVEKLRFWYALRIALFFGLFQALMPVLGWAVGCTISDFIRAFDHWIAFGLLAFIGIKMIVESRSKQKDHQSKNCRHFPTLLLLAVATSIDALAAGIGFACLRMSIIGPVAVIGVITFLVCLAGVYFGNRSSRFLGDKFELAGGVILIGIGIKIVAEHLIKGI